MSIINFYKNKKGFTICEILIVISIIWFVISIDDHTRSHCFPIREDKVCQRTQRIIGYTIEKYCEDNKDTIDKILPGGDFENFLIMLEDKGYIKELRLPGPDCSYGIIDSNIFCKKHGANYSIKKGYLYSDSVPEYDKKQEKPFSTKHQQKIDDFIKEKIIAEKRKMILGYLKTPIWPILIFVIAITMGVHSNSKTKK